MNTIAINLIKKWEGCKLNTYRCSANVLTIGYGHTKPILFKDIDPKDPIIELFTNNTLEYKISKDTKITQKTADNLLERDLVFFSQKIKEITKGLKLKENEEAALISFAFNLGVNALKNSTLLQVIKESKGVKCMNENKIEALRARHNLSASDFYTYYNQNTLHEKYKDVFYKEIKGQFLRWVYVDGKKLKGLENRRKDEFLVYAG